MNKEIKTDHFRTLEELLENCKMWIREEDYYAYNRYFEMQCMEEMYEYIVELQKENEKYKEVINKINKKLDSFIECCKAERLESGSDYLHHSYWNMFENFNKQIKEMVKEVK